MGLTGVLRQVSLEICPHCNKEYGKHSKKGFMKCLYTANWNLYNIVIELNELKSKQPLKIPEKIVVDEHGKVKVTPIQVDEDKDKSKDNWKKELKKGQSIATEKPDE